MEQSTNNKKQLPINKFNESILVVKRKNLFPKGDWLGIKQVDFEQYLKLVQEHQEFMPRGLAEEDATYKQVIPYLVFRHNDLYFLMQRKNSSSEQRLASKYSLGIGGHLREEDMKGSSIIEWAQREFDEEINYTGSVTITPLGILNSEETPVDQVHIGFVLLLEGDSEDISIRSELQSGELVSLAVCKEKDLEGWSRFVVDYLERYNTR
jgi:predicted NUDIX family phosphoesterase